VKETTTRKTGVRSGARNQSFTKAISKRSSILRKSKVDKMRGVEPTVSPDQQLKKQNKKIRSVKTKFSDASWAKQQRQRTQWQKRKLVNLTVSSTGNPKKKKQQQTQKQTKPQDIKISVNSNTNQPRRTRANLQGGITKRTNRVVKTGRVVTSQPAQLQPQGGQTLSDRFGGRGIRRVSRGSSRGTSRGARGARGARGTTRVAARVATRVAPRVATRIGGRGGGARGGRGAGRGGRGGARGRGAGGARKRFLDRT